jgi:carbonic anhydrase
MRLFEAIVDANHRAAAGDQHAGLHPSEFESELPIIALTCIDVRLNPLLPEVLGVPKEQCREHHHRPAEQHHALARAGVRP